MCLLSRPDQKPRNHFQLFLSSTSLVTRLYQFQLFSISLICFFFFFYFKWNRSVMSNSFATPWTIAYRLLRPWNFPGKSTVVGCHFLLQRIFPTQGSNLGLPYCGQALYLLSHQGSLCCSPFYCYSTFIVSHLVWWNRFLTSLLSPVSLSPSLQFTETWVLIMSFPLPS